MSVFVTICLLVTTLWPADAFSSPNTQTANGIPPQSHLETLTDFTGDLLPSHLGSVEEMFQTSDARDQSSETRSPIVLIKDAHSVGSAQKSIANLIRFFEEKYHVKNVALEGFEGELDNQLLRSYPFKKKLKDFLNPLLSQGELSGAAVQSLYSKSETVYRGIDNEDLYLRNVEAYLTGSRIQKTLIQQIQKHERELSEVKKATLSSEDGDLDHTLSSFASKEITLHELLLRTGHLLHENLSENQWELLRAYYELITKTDSQSERIFLQEALRQFSRADAPAEWKARINQWAQQWQTGRLSTADVSFRLSQAPFAKDIKDKLQEMGSHHETLKRMEDKAFIDELEAWVKTLRGNVFLNHPELLNRTIALELLNQLVTFKMTPEDWDDWAKYAHVYSHAFDVSVFELFYELAIQRDHVFLEKLSDSEQTQLTVLGGFHIENLSLQLRKINRPYIVITPFMDDLEGYESYASHMHGLVRWSSYFSERKGKLSAYDAFHKYAVQSLIQSKKESLAERQIAKIWRDQILKDLAQQKLIERHVSYTQYLDGIFLDEDIQRRTHWENKFEKFITGLKGLEDRNDYNFQSVQSLAYSLTLPWTANPFAHRQVPKNFWDQEERLTNKVSSDSKRSESRIQNHALLDSVTATKVIYTVNKEKAFRYLKNGKIVEPLFMYPFEGYRTEDSEKSDGMIYFVLKVPARYLSVSPEDPNRFALSSEVPLPTPFERDLYSDLSSTPVIAKMNAEGVGIRNKDLNRMGALPLREYIQTEESLALNKKHGIQGRELKRLKTALNRSDLGERHPFDTFMARTGLIIKEAFLRYGFFNLGMIKEPRTFTPVMMTFIFFTSFFYFQIHTLLYGELTKEIYSFLAFTLLAPVWEEYAFRKGLFRRVLYRAFDSPFFPMVVSSSLFAFIHTTQWGDPQALGEKFLVGGFLAMSYLLTRSLFVPVVLHMIINGLIYMFYPSLELAYLYAGLLWAGGISFLSVGLGGILGQFKYPGAWKSEDDQEIDATYLYQQRDRSERRMQESDEFKLSGNLPELLDRVRGHYEEMSGEPFPEDPEAKIAELESQQMIEEGEVDLQDLISELERWLSIKRAQVKMVATEKKLQSARKTVRHFEFMSKLGWLSLPSKLFYVFIVVGIQKHGLKAILTIYNVIFSISVFFQLFKADNEYGFIRSLFGTLMLGGLFQNIIHLIFSGFTKSRKEKDAEDEIKLFSLFHAFVSPRALLFVVSPIVLLASYLKNGWVADFQQAVALFIGLNFHWFAAGLLFLLSFLPLIFSSETREEKYHDDDKDYSIKEFIASVVFAPIREEVWYRFLFFNISAFLWNTVVGLDKPVAIGFPLLGLDLALNISLGTMIAILANAGLFFRAHGERKWFHHWVGGILLSYAYFMSGSLLVPILMHFFWNLLVKIYDITIEQPIVNRDIGFNLMVGEDDRSELRAQKDSGVLVSELRVLKGDELKKALSDSSSARLLPNEYQEAAEELEYYREAIKEHETIMENRSDVISSYLHKSLMKGFIFGFFILLFDMSFLNPSFPVIAVLFFALMSAFNLFIHEFAHWIAAKSLHLMSLVKGEPLFQRVLLKLRTMIVVPQPVHVFSQKPVHVFLVSLAGPAANLLISFSAMMLLIYSFTQSFHFAYSATWIMGMNFLGFSNLRLYLANMHDEDISFFKTDGKNVKESLWLKKHAENVSKRIEGLATSLGEIRGVIFAGPLEYVGDALNADVLLLIGDEIYLWREDSLFEGLSEIPFVFMYDFSEEHLHVLHAERLQLSETEKKHDSFNRPRALFKVVDFPEEYKEKIPQSTKPRSKEVKQKQSQRSESRRAWTSNENWNRFENQYDEFFDLLDAQGYPLSVHHLDSGSLRIAARSMKDRLGPRVVAGRVLSANEWGEIEEQLDNIEELARSEDATKQWSHEDSKISRAKKIIREIVSILNRLNEEDPASEKWVGGEQSAVLQSQDESITVEVTKEWIPGQIGFNEAEVKIKHKNWNFSKSVKLKRLIDESPEQVARKILQLKERKPKIEASKSKWVRMLEEELHVTRTLKHSELSPETDGLYHMILKALDDYGIQGGRQKQVLAVDDAGLNTWRRQSYHNFYDLMTRRGIHFTRIDKRGEAYERVGPASLSDFFEAPVNFAGFDAAFDVDTITPMSELNLRSMEDNRNLYREMAEAVKPGGLVVISHHWDPMHGRPFISESWFRSIGLELIDVRYPGVTTRFFVYRKIDIAGQSPLSQLELSYRYRGQSFTETQSRFLAWTGDVEQRFKEKLKEFSAEKADEIFVLFSLGHLLPNAYDQIALQVGREGKGYQGRINLKVTLSPKGRLTFTLEDNGSGIPKKKLEELIDHWVYSQKNQGNPLEGAEGSYRLFGQQGFGLYETGRLLAKNSSSRIEIETLNDDGKAYRKTMTPISGEHQKQPVVRAPRPIRHIPYATESEWNSEVIEIHPDYLQGGVKTRFRVSYQLEDAIPPGLEFDAVLAESHWALEPRSEVRIHKDLNAIIDLGWANYREELSRTRLSDFWRPWMGIIQAEDQAVMRALADNEYQRNLEFRRIRIKNVLDAEVEQLMAEMNAVKPEQFKNQEFDFDIRGNSKLGSHMKRFLNETISGPLTRIYVATQEENPVKAFRMIFNQLSLRGLLGDLTFTLYLKEGLFKTDPLIFYIPGSDPAVVQGALESIRAAYEKTPSIFRLTEKKWHLSLRSEMGDLTLPLSLEPFVSFAEVENDRKRSSYRYDVADGVISSEMGVRGWTSSEKKFKAYETFSKREGYMEKSPARAYRMPVLVDRERDLAQTQKRNEKSRDARAELRNSESTEERDEYGDVPGRVFSNPGEVIRTYSDYDSSGKRIVDGSVEDIIGVAVYAPKMKKWVTKQLNKLGDHLDVLSIGVGQGHFEEDWVKQGHHVFGLDLNAGNLAWASEKGIETMEGDIHEFPQIDREFDVIVFSESIVHLDVQKVLKGVKSYLKPGGHVVILTFGFADLVKPGDFDSTLNNNFYSASELEKQFLRVGYDLSKKDVRIKRIHEDPQNPLGIYWVQARPRAELRNDSTKLWAERLELYAEAHSQAERFKGPGLLGRLLGRNPFQSLAARIVDEIYFDPDADARERKREALGEIAAPYLEKDLLELNATEQILRLARERILAGKIPDYSRAAFMRRSAGAALSVFLPYPKSLREFVAAAKKTQGSADIPLTYGVLSYQAMQEASERQTHKLFPGEVINHWHVLFPGGFQLEQDHGKMLDEKSEKQVSGLKILDSTPFDQLPLSLQWKFTSDFQTAFDDMLEAFQFAVKKGIHPRLQTLLVTRSTTLDPYRKSLWDIYEAYKNQDESHLKALRKEWEKERDIFYSLHHQSKFMDSEREVTATSLLYQERVREIEKEARWMEEMLWKARQERLRGQAAEEDVDAASVFEKWLHEEMYWERQIKNKQVQLKRWKDAEEKRSSEILDTLIDDRRRVLAGTEFNLKSQFSHRNLPSSFQYSLDLKREWVEKITDYDLMIDFIDGLLSEIDKEAAEPVSTIIRAELRSENYEERDIYGMSEETPVPTPKEVLEVYANVRPDGSFNEQSVADFVSAGKKYPDTVDWIADLMDVEAAGKPLDILSVGVGHAYFDHEWIKSGHRVVGMDINGDSLAVAETKGVETVLGDIHDFPDVGKKFDLIVFPESWGHLDGEKVLEGLHQYLKPEGRVVVLALTRLDMMETGGYMPELKHNFFSPLEIGTRFKHSGYVPDLEGLGYLPVGDQHALMWLPFDQGDDARPELRSAQPPEFISIWSEGPSVKVLVSTIELVRLAKERWPNVKFRLFYEEEDLPQAKQYFKEYQAVAMKDVQWMKIEKAKPDQLGNHAIWINNGNIDYRHKIVRQAFPRGDIPDVNFWNQPFKYLEALTEIDEAKALEAYGFKRKPIVFSNIAKNEYGFAASVVKELIRLRKNNSALKHRPIIMVPRDSHEARAVKKALRYRQVNKFKFRVPPNEFEADDSPGASLIIWNDWGNLSELLKIPELTVLGATLIQKYDPKYSHNIAENYAPAVTGYFVDTDLEGRSGPNSSALAVKAMVDQSPISAVQQLGELKDPKVVAREIVSILSDEKRYRDMAEANRRAREKVYEDAKLEVSKIFDGFEKPIRAERRSVDQMILRLFEELGISAYNEIRPLKGLPATTPWDVVLKVIQAMDIPEDGDVNVLDLGSGKGWFVLRLALLKPKIKKIIGLEHDEQLVRELNAVIELAEKKEWIRPGQIEVHQGDYNKDHQKYIETADVLYYAQSGTFVPQLLSETLEQYAKSGAKIVSDHAGGPEGLVFDPVFFEAVQNENGVVHVKRSIESIVGQVNSDSILRSLTQGPQSVSQMLSVMRKGFRNLSALDLPQVQRGSSGHGLFVEGQELMPGDVVIYNMPLRLRGRVKERIKILKESHLDPRSDPSLDFDFLYDADKNLSSFRVGRVGRFWYWDKSRAEWTLKNPGVPSRMNFQLEGDALFSDHPDPLMVGPHMKNVKIYLLKRSQDYESEYLGRAELRKSANEVLRVFFRKENVKGVDLPPMRQLEGALRSGFEEAYMRHVLMPSILTQIPESEQVRNVGVALNSFKEDAEEYLENDVKNTLHFSFAVPYVNSDAYRDWLSRYVNAVSALRHQYGDMRVKADIRLLTSSAERRSADAWLKPFVKSGLVKTIDMEGSHAVMEIERFLRDTPNALLFNRDYFEESLNQAYRIRLVHMKGVQWSEAFAFSGRLTLASAKVDRISAEWMKAVVKQFSPDTLALQNGNLTLLSGIRDLIRLAVNIQALKTSA